MGNGGGRANGVMKTWQRNPHGSPTHSSVLAATLLLLLLGAALLGLSFLPSAGKSAAGISESPLFSLPSANPLPTSSTLRATSRHSKPDVRAIFGGLPLIFEPNQGQADPEVKFLARGAGYGLLLDAAGATLSVQTPRGKPSEKNYPGQRIRMNLVGVNPAAVAVGTDPLPGKSNYILGNDPQKWHSGIPQFAGVRYQSVYPGIDLVFYGNQGRLEYDFRVAPGADPAQAELQFEGTKRLQLSDGDLILAGTASRGLRLEAPQVYQLEGKQRRPVPGRFVLRAHNCVGFEIGAYDRSRELIIDPVLKFSTYFGGTGAVTSPSVAVNGDGNIYMVGSTTSSTGFPLNGTPSTQIGPGAHVFVAKITPSYPPAVVYMTFLGGSGTDLSVGLGVNNAGLTYIVGNTTSPDFPVTGSNVLGYQTTPTTKGSQCTGITCYSLFVSVLNQTGTAPLIYSTYISGTGNDQASGMAIDLIGDVFITGTTTSTTPADAPSQTVAFPATYLPVPFQTVPSSSLQFFVTKVNTALPGTSGIAYSTLFGGASPIPPIAVGGGITVDTTGNMYFSGTTNFFNSGLGQYGDSNQSTDFPILNAYQPCLDTPPPVTLTIQNPCTAPTTTPYPTDAFAAKLNPFGAAGTQLLFSTYLGGSVNDGSTAIAIDSGAANIYLTGSTNSSDFVLPTGTAAYQECLDTPPPNVLPCPITSTPTNPAAPDAFVARMSNPTVSTTGTPNDVQLNYFSYLGGSLNDDGLAIAVLDTASTTLNDIVVTGSTNSTNFPVTATCPSPPCVIQSTLNGTQNAFYAQIDTTTITGQTNGSYVTYFGGNGTDRGTSIAVDPSQNAYFVGDTTSTNLQVVDSLPGAGGTTFNGTMDGFIVKLGTATDLCISCVAPVINPAGVVSAGNQVTVTYTVANEGPDPATNITVTGIISQPATFNSASAASGTCGAPSGATAVCLIPALQSGSTATVQFVVTPTAEASYQLIATVSNANDTNPSNSATASFTSGGFTPSISPPTQTVPAGMTATYYVSVSPQPVFGSNVSLSCSTLPQGAHCNFTSSSLTLNGPQTSTLNLTTTAQPVPTADSHSAHRLIYAVWLLVPGIGIWGLGSRSERRKARFWGWLALCTLFTLVFLQPSCKKTPIQPAVSGTPTGTYSLRVIATSGSFTQSVSFTLTVTP